MTDQLPPNLRALFTARPALKYLQPHDHAQEERCTRHISGVAQFLPQLAEYKETDVYNATESHNQRKTRLKEEKKAAHKVLMESAPTTYKPSADPNISGDAYKTLFISRLDYGIEEKDLRKVFSAYGAIDDIRLIKNEKGKSRGYGFILYSREDDMKAAYKDTDGIQIKGRRVCVDVERGRTVTGWKPRRLGGGLGGRHYTRGPMPSQQMGRGGPPAGPGGFRGGGFQGGRGGFSGGRGGFRGDFGGGRGGGYRGDRGGYGGGGRGGIGYQSNGFQPGGPPNGAPSGPRGGRGGGGGFQGGSGGYGRDRSYDDRRSGGGGMGGGNSSGSNREPVGQRGSGGGYRDRDREGGGYGGGRDDRKRGYDDDGYDANRNKRRY